MQTYYTLKLHPHMHRKLQPNLCAKLDKRGLKEIRHIENLLILGGIPLIISGGPIIPRGGPPIQGGLSPNGGGPIGGILRGGIPLGGIWANASGGGGIGGGRLFTEFTGD